MGRQDTKYEFFRFEKYLASIEYYIVLIITIKTSIRVARAAVNWVIAI